MAYLDTCFPDIQSEPRPIIASCSNCKAKFVAPPLGLERGEKWPCYRCGGEVKFLEGINLKNWRKK